LATQELNKTTGKRKEAITKRKGRPRENPKYKGPPPAKITTGPWQKARKK